MAEKIDINELYALMMKGVQAGHYKPSDVFGVFDKTLKEFLVVKDNKLDFTDYQRKKMELASTPIHMLSLNIQDDANAWQREDDAYEYMDDMLYASDVEERDTAHLRTLIEFWKIDRVKREGSISDFYKSNVDTRFGSFFFGRMMDAMILLIDDFDKKPFLYLYRSLKKKIKNLFKKKEKTEVLSQAAKRYYERHVLPYKNSKQ